MEAVMRTMKIELPYEIHTLGIRNITYYARLVGLNFCGKPQKTKALAVKSLRQVIREMETFWLESYKNRDEAGVSLVRE